GRRAAALLADAGKAAAKHGLRHLAVAAIYDDAELALMLGRSAVGPAPWAGPVMLSETEDGEILRGLSAAAVEGLQATGVAPDAAVVALLGARELDGAPGVNVAALHERGFTDHEIEAALTALDSAGALRAAFAPAVVGAGFVRDVLGADAEALDDPQLDVLALAGFSADEIEAAERYALGGALAASDLPAAAKALLAGGAEIAAPARLAMARACEALAGAPAIGVVEIDWTTGAAEVAALIAETARAGGRAIALRRRDPPLDFRLELPEAPEPAAKPAPQPIVTE